MSRKEIHKQNLSKYLIDVLVELVMDYVYLENVMIIIKLFKRRHLKLSVHDNRIYVINLRYITVFDLKLNKIKEIKYGGKNISICDIHVDNEHIYLSFEDADSIHILSRITYEFIKCVNINFKNNKMPIIRGDNENLYIGNNYNLQIIQKNGDTAQLFENFSNFCVDKKNIYVIENDKIIIFDKYFFNEISNNKMRNEYNIRYKSVINDNKYILFKCGRKIIIVGKETKEVIDEIDISLHFSVKYGNIYDIKIYDGKVYMILVIGNGNYLCVME